MKKLSDTLIKNYIVFFIFQIIGAILILTLICNYILSQSVENIMSVKVFIEEELKEPEHQDIDYFYKTSIVESPTFRDLYLKLQYKELEYAPHNFPEINSKKLKNKIHVHGFYDYYSYQSDVNKLNGETVSVSIVKELSYEKKFIKKIIFINIFVLSFLTLFEFYLLKQSLKNISSQLEYIENITTNITLDNLIPNINKSSYFKEFSNLINSYSNMVERLRVQIAAQVEFVHNASHELKTPLFIISSYLSMLNKRGRKDGEIFNECVDSIKDETNSMISLTEKLLFLSRTENFNLQIEPFDIKELISDLIIEFSVITPEQKFSILSNESVELKTDCSLIKQLLRNIITNAIKYGQNKEIDIDYYTDEFNLYINIQDYGLGIDEKQRKKIFDKFYMVDSSREQKQKSHGLGLSIVKKILNYLNGNIDINSELNHGTTVIISFPKQYKSC